MAKEITDQNFEQTILENSLVLVDFWASWCGPCVMMGPLVDELAEENDDVVIGKLNVNKNQDTTLAYGVTSIPTFILFKDGKEVNRVRGALRKTQLQELIDEFKN